MEPLSKQCARSILIADDQSAFQKLLCQLLAGVATEVIECNDGAQAVAAFEQHRPDWALLDWMMPNLDGVAAARAIRARHPQARVVIFSVHSAPALVREAVEAGACAYFPKERLQDLVALLRDSPSSAEAAINAIIPKSL